MYHTQDQPCQHGLTGQLMWNAIGLDEQIVDFSLSPDNISPPIQIMRPDGLLSNVEMAIVPA
jgi:hypothetical protein